MPNQTVHAGRRALGTVVLSLSSFLAVWGAVPQSAYAQTELERAGARDAATQGLAAYNQKDYAQAFDLFQRAESVLHAPTHLLYIARSAVGLGQLVRAREIYMRLKREQLPARAPAAFVDAQNAASSELALLEPRVPRLKIVVTGANNATVLLDEQPLAGALVGVSVPIDPGKHRVVATAPNGRKAEQFLEIKESASETATLSLSGSSAAGPTESTPAPPAPSSHVPAASFTTESAAPSSNSNSTLRIASYAAFGVGIVGLGAGTFFMLRSGSKADDADALYEKKGCPEPTCKPADKNTITSLDDDAASAKTMGVIGLVTGGVGIAAGVTLYVLSTRKATTKTALVLPYVGSNELGVVGRF